ncbi:MAG: hypothetical protein QF664_08030 [Dehalococcoidia bacterium]|nr:hypothetical protein [Dehalococcoidia bacterium]
MSWLTRVLRRGDRREEVRQAACAHTNLTARWDDAQDVGKAEKTSRYACVSCGEMFTRDEAQTLGGTYAA